MKAKELLDLSNDDLHSKRRELKLDNFNMRLQQQLGQLEKPHRLRANRKDIARIETILNQRTKKPAAIRKSRVGEVVSTKMQKTIVVQTVTRVPHAKFGKIIKQRRKFYAHDEEGKAQQGDTVRIEETRPLSKLKRWKLVEVLKH